MDFMYVDSGMRGLRPLISTIRTIGIKAGQNPMLKLKLCVQVCVLVAVSQARLVDLHQDSRESVQFDAQPRATCDTPVSKAKVVFPQNLVGRSKYNDGYTMYSGYVPVTDEDWLFYWFFEQTNATASAKGPLMLWSNGGPGCSAMEGATTENGPMVLDMIKQSVALPTGQLTDNPYSWVNLANVLYVDQPRYVGFSTGKGKYVSNSVDAGKDIVTFLGGWLKLFPEFAGRELVLSSESYGGHCKYFGGCMNMGSGLT
jgi:carboxypeptidase C (cathepsin A)